MTAEAVLTTKESIRRLVVTKQHLSGTLPRRVKADDIVSLIRDLPFVQWDPVTVVAPSHVISLWSRLGPFRQSDLDRLMWDERKVFLHWTPIAFLVLTEDYPLYRSLMERYPESLTKSWGNHARRARDFLIKHADLRKRMRNDLRRGPLQLGQFRDHVRTRRSEDGWSSGSDVSTMLHHMHMSGEVMVVGRQGNQNLWGLTEEFLPDWVDKTALSEEQFEREAALRALGGLGAATPREIVTYFPPGRYRNLKKTLRGLEDESLIRRVTAGAVDAKSNQYMLTSDLPLLEEVAGRRWEPRMSLLPPFDNLLRGTERTRRLFDFKYIREQFLPRKKRKYGTYVLPVLWGDRLIGRIDPRLDKNSRRLIVNSVHAEPGAPGGKEMSRMIGETIERLGDFLGATEVVYEGQAPDAWRGSLS